MAQPLDLQEQEQLDALKTFWKSYGNLITWALIAALAVYAGLNGWKWWQRDQSAKAAAMFDQLELAAQGGDAQILLRLVLSPARKGDLARVTAQVGPPLGDRSTRSEI